MQAHALGARAELIFVKTSCWAALLLEFSLLRVQVSENGNSENFEKNSFFEKNLEIFNFLIFRQNLGNNVI